MAYPAGVITRPVTFGPAFELEDGDVAGMTVSFKATRPGVLWMATGSPAVSTAITRNADDGVEQTVYLPVTDQAGWGDGDGNAIDPGENGNVFLYSVSVVFTQNGKTIAGAQPRTKTVAIPQGDLSPLDLDKLLPLTSPGGTVVSVPDIWSQQIADAEAAAEAASVSAAAAAGSLLASDSFVAGKVADSGSLTGAAVTAKMSALVQWAKNPDQLIAGAITYTAGLPSSAVVEWPDGKPGILTILSRQSGTDAVTSYKITHVDGPTTLTYTQPTITRNTDGAATLVPQIVVS